MDIYISTEKVKIIFIILELQKIRTGKQWINQTPLLLVKCIFYFILAFLKKKKSHLEEVAEN